MFKDLEETISKVLRESMRMIPQQTENFNKKTEII